MDNRVVVVGASGQTKIVVDALEQAGQYKVVGFLDSYKPKGTPWYGYRVLGTEEDLPEVCERQGVIGGIIGIGDNAVRGRMAERMQQLVPQFRFINAIHPSVFIARGVKQGVGVLMMAGAVVNPDCVVGDHSTIDTGATLDHDSVIGRCVSLAPNVATGGGVTIGDYTAVSIGASVSHGRTIGAHSVIGAGAVVVRDIPDHVVAYGTPARVVRSREEGEPYL